MMGTTSLPVPHILHSIDVVSATSNGLHISWSIDSIHYPGVEGFRVFYKEAQSLYTQESGILPAQTNDYKIDHLFSGKEYKVCVSVYRNSTTPVDECILATTTKWHIPVSIGSSIGAFIALAFIVLMVMLARCKAKKKKPPPRRRQSSRRKESYHAMGNNNQMNKEMELSDLSYTGNQDDMVTLHVPNPPTSSNEASHEATSSSHDLNSTDTHEHFSPTSPRTLVDLEPSTYANSNASGKKFQFSFMQSVQEPSASSSSSPPLPPIRDAEDSSSTTMSNDKISLHLNMV